MKAGSGTIVGLAPDAVPIGTPGPGTKTEALFREARRRRRRRWLFAAIGVVVLTAAAVIIGGRSSPELPQSVTGAGLPSTATSSNHVRYFTEVSAAMEPTLAIGDRVAADTRFSSFQTGDVVVFTPPSAQRGPAISFEIKRVIGLPGETIALSGDTVFINGRPLSEPYLPPGQPLGPPIATQTIPAGRYFVLGDNRTNSQDSRFFGPIPATSVVGVVTSIVAPPSRAGPISRRSATGPANKS
jgi:signal peptidase I